jgi:hypothetical protein
MKQAMYDYPKVVEAYRKFVPEFDADMHMGLAGPGSGKVFELTDYKLYAWAGHGVGENSSYQALEGEYMKADEYDALIDDPSDFWIHKYLPRVYGILNPALTMIPTLTSILEIYGSAFNFIPFGLPPVQQALKSLMAAGEEALRYAGVVGGFNDEMAAAGYPLMLANGFSKVPFDTLGDTLRGMKGVLMDMYRQPNNVLKAVERLTPIMIKMGIAAAQMNGHPLVFIPLHKGADGFMSEEQFKKFYWPGFREVLLGLIEGGCIPWPVAEGSWGSRLKLMKDLPKGKILWTFDQMDMAKAKEIIGATQCISGNMPSSYLSLSSVQEVKDYSKKLIDTCGKGGGFIMANGAFFDHCKPENLKAMIEYTKQYGKYK